MKLTRKVWSIAAALSLALVVQHAIALDRDVPFVPTPQAVVDEMLKLARVGADDTLYDLGSGDGRIVITAAKEYGARGVGVDIDPERIAESRANARRAGVDKKVRFIQGNLFEVDLRPATAVTLYLLPDVNLRLRPKLLKELRPGTPIVSHSFDMGDWEPEKTATVQGATVYLWHVPARATGVWEYRIATADGRTQHHRLDIVQRLQKIEGTLTIDGQAFPVKHGYVNAQEITFAVDRPRHGNLVTERYKGRIIDNQVAGVAVLNDPGLAKRGTVAVSR